MIFCNLIILHAMCIATNEFLDADKDSNKQIWIVDEQLLPQIPKVVTDNFWEGKTEYAQKWPDIRNGWDE
jgi:hypothetical protein